MFNCKYFKAHSMTVGFVFLWIIQLSGNTLFNKTYELNFNNAHWQNQNTVRLSFQFVGRLVTLQAQVEGQVGTFILDTGASSLLLNERYFDTPSKASEDRAYASTGEISAGTKTYIDSLKIQRLLIPSIKGRIVDISQIEDRRNEKISGILGYNVFKGFEIFIDYPYRQIILTKVDKRGNRFDPAAIPEIAMDSLSFSLIKHAIVIKAMLKGEELKFNLDTGAEINLLDSRVSPHLLENFSILRRVNMIGIGSKKVEVLAGKLDGLICGPGPPYSMRTLLANTDYIRQSTNIRVDGVLGYEYLFLRRISINYARKKIYFYTYKELKP